MISNQALRSIKVLLIEDFPSDANLTVKGFLNAQTANDFHWVEYGKSATISQLIQIVQIIKDLLLIAVTLPQK